MKVSVIVPVYNVESYLKKCLDSLINQDFSDYEIIVVNDGSKDNSEAIILEYKEKYPKKIKYFKKENGGLSSARNLGIKKSSGIYLAFVDSDDYVDSSFLKCLYEKACKDDSDIVICDIFKKGEDFVEILNGKKNKSMDTIKDCMISLPAAWNKLYKRDLFIKNNIFYAEGIYYEDLATTPRLILNAKKISYVKKPLYYYMVRTGSITHQVKYNPKTADMFESLEIVRTYFKENHYLDTYLEELEYLYIVNLLHSYVITVYKYKEAKDNIYKAINILKTYFPTWQENIYFKNDPWKFKLVCKLIYRKQIFLLKLLLK